MEKRDLPKGVWAEPDLLASLPRLFCSYQSSLPLGFLHLTWGYACTCLSESHPEVLGLVRGSGLGALDPPWGSMSSALVLLSLPPLVTPSLRRCAGE